MNKVRADKLLENQSAMAQKIFRAVPMQEYWSVHQIRLELERLGTPAASHVIGGCLRHLKDAHLVECNAQDQYRSCVKPVRIMKEEPIVEPKKQPLTFAERLLAKAEALRKEADELEALAMQVEEEIQKAGDAKLANLRNALKELTGGL